MTPRIVVFMQLTDTARRAALALGLAERAEDTGSGPAGVMPPPRESSAAVTPREALSLDAVYRAFFVLQTATEQLTLDAWQDGARVPGTELPQLVRKPDPDRTLTDWLGELVTTLAARGNAYLRIYRWNDGTPVAAKLLPPGTVHPFFTRAGDKRFSYLGRDWGPRDIRQLRLLKLAAEPEGLGPIQAAQRGLRGKLDTATYGDGFMAGNVPNGVLASEQQLTAEDAALYKSIWRDSVRYDDGPAVLGKGLAYEPLLLKPSEAQWLEAQQFGIGGVARLMGMPARYLLAAIDGSSETYANVEQEDQAFIRFTLMRYLREIETTLDELLPRTTTTRFVVDGLLRSDTLTRYRAHSIGLGSRFLTVPEVRAIEGLRELTADELAELLATETTTTDQELTA